MSAYVILRNGKVLQYNECESVVVENGAFALRDCASKYLIARIPLDIVERVEFGKPCKILREKPLREIRRKY